MNNYIVLFYKQQQQHQDVKRGRYQCRIPDGLFIDLPIPVPDKDKAFPGYISTCSSNPSKVQTKIWVRYYREESKTLTGNR